MSGGLAQLVMYGAQDVYLTGDPQITFWKNVYKRYTNFALESIEQDVLGHVNYGNEITTIIGRQGDLINGVMLEITLQRGDTNPLLPQPYFPSEHLINYVELMIGGQKVFEFDHEWFRMFFEMYLDLTQQLSYRSMCDFGNEPQGYEKTFYLPLPFWFNNLNNGIALPLIALQYHEVQINIRLSKAGDIPGIDTSFTPIIKCYADYVFVDTKERTWFAQNKHEYIITQVQRNIMQTPVLSSEKEYKMLLNFNHPTQLLLWAMVPSLTTHGQFTGEPGEQTSDVLAPLAYCKLSLNGVDRMSRRKGSYFRYYQPWSSANGSFLTAGIYLYSFGTSLKYGVPSGTLNFSRVDNAILHLNTKEAVIADNLMPANVNETMTTVSANILSMTIVYAVNFNVLRIQSGMGGVAFSN